MTTSHTSGRWSAINDGLGWYVFAMPYDDTSYPICVIGTHSPGCNEANARLIADAPRLFDENVQLKAINKELLAVLKETLAAAELPASARRERAIKAIANAEGQA